MSAPKRLRVAICGAGIGGLTLAVALARYPDIEVNIYEQATKLAEIGAGIGFFTRPWKIFQALGLDEDLLKVTEVKHVDGYVKSLRYRKSDQPHGFDFYTLVTRGNLITFHRADFQATLLRHLPSTCRTYCQKRLRSYTQSHSGGVQLLFEDGSTAWCDILIGADGYKSVVRKGILSEYATRYPGGQQNSDILRAIQPIWTGTYAYRALIPAEKLRARYPNHRALTTPNQVGGRESNLLNAADLEPTMFQFLGKDAYVIAYPIQHGRMINFVAFVFHPEEENTKFEGNWVSLADKSDFVSKFSHWEEEVRALMDCVEKPLKWAIHTVDDMPTYVSGRVCVMGDAAHAQAPHQGSGAGQAVEDAYVLANILGHPRTTASTLSRALKVYDEVRRPFTHAVQEKSRLNGRLFSLCSDYVKSGSVDELKKLGDKFYQNWEWAWNTTIDDTVIEVKRRLDTMRVSS